MKERVLDTIPEDTIKNLTSLQEFSYCAFDTPYFSSLGMRKGLIHVFLSNRLLNTKPLEVAIKQAEENLKNGFDQSNIVKVVNIDLINKSFTAINIINNKETTFKFLEFQNQEIINSLKENLLLEIIRGSESTYIGGRRYFSILKIY